MTNPASENNDFDTLLMGMKGDPAVKFPTPGSFVEGTVVAKEAAPKRKFNRNPNAPVEYELYKTGPNAGQPIKELIVTLQTALRDPAIENDRGLRRVFFPFQMQQELAKAVKTAGGQGLPIGAFLRIVFTHEIPSQGGGSPRKEYSVEYRAPEDHMIAQTPAPAQQQVYQPPVQQSYAPTQQVSSVVTPPVGSAQAVPALPQLSPELLAALQAQGVAIPGQAA
jgi:hypothetical protein